MPEETQQTDGPLEHPSVRSEKTDANFKWILGLLIGALALGVVIFYMVKVFFTGEEKLLNARRKSTFPLAPTLSRELPPEPRLEPLDRMEEVTSSNGYLREKVKLDTLETYGPSEEEWAFLGAETLGLMGVASGPLLVSTSLFPGRHQRIQTSTYIHIPIDQAMQLVIRDLKVRKETAEQKELQQHENGLVDHGEPNSGRMFKRRNPQWFGK